MGGDLVQRFPKYPQPAVKSRTRNLAGMCADGPEPLVCWGLQAPRCPQAGLAAKEIRVAARLQSAWCGKVEGTALGPAERC